MVSRFSVCEDSEAIAKIYNQGIEERNSTFEIRLRSSEDILDWFNSKHQIVVVEESGEVIAFASASTYRARECYAGIAEFSVYVKNDCRGRGAGKLALTTPLDVATQAGYWKVLSRVFIENAHSRSLLKSLGFREVGVYEKHGKLDGKWRDVVIVEKLIERNLR